MPHVPSPEEAMEILKKYNKEAFHIQHAETVGKVLYEFAKTRDPGREDYWRAVGILHDIDFELYPEQHCRKAPELLRENDVDESIIHAVVSHGYGICADVEPTLEMEKLLFAADELTGLIGAAALMRPTGMEGMEVKSVMKKFKDKRFAAKCARQLIVKGCELLGMEVRDVAEICISGMKEHAEELGLTGAAE